MIWLLVSIVGLIIVIFTIRYYYNQNKEITSGKISKFSIVLLILGSVASGSTLLYLGLLLILFGIVKAAGLL